jgi:AcrR family transcriptional regulator
MAAAPSSAAQDRTEAEAPCGRPRRFSRDQIVGGALELLQAGGLEVMTVKALSKHLGTGEGTIYSYTPSKDEVLRLVATHLLRSTAVPSSDLEWDAWICELVWNVRETFRPHPWVDSRMLTPQAWEEASEAMMEVGNAVGHRAGFSAESRCKAISMLYYFVTGVVLVEDEQQRADDRSTSVEAALEILVAGMRAQLSPS